ncbi:hypothetical protein Tco_1063224, partial [Tanacetum coccineum]
MNPQETEQVIARDELWVPTAERVNISTTNVRLETTVKQKEETFQVVIDVIKNSTCIKAFKFNSPFLSDVPEFDKQQFWFTITKIKASESYEFLLSDKSVDRSEDNGVVSRLKFVRMGEDVQQYGLAIPATMLNNKIIQSESYKMFILYSTGQIPPKKSRGKVPLIRRKTSSRRVVKKKATISVDDNIIPEPDIALELGKSISLTKAKEESCIKTKFMPLKQNVSNLSPNLREEDGTGEIPGVPDESIFADAEDDNEETESDSDDIYKYKINVRKNVDIEMKDTKKTADITKETTKQPLTSSSFFMPSHYGNQFLNLCHNEEIFKQPPILQQTTPIPTTITTPPINTKAPAITTTIPEITPFIALQLRVAKLEQDMSEVKKIDHSAAVLASIQSHVPPVVDYALIKFIHKNKSANRNPANYRLYHALMEALIEDENVIDKEVADMVKDHKKKHDDDDDDDDDDDEGPPAGSNQGKSTKRRRTRESESAKNPSTTKESSMDKNPKVGSKTGKSALAKDPVEEPTDEVIMDEQPTEDI